MTVLNIVTAVGVFVTDVADPFACRLLSCRVMNPLRYVGALCLGREARLGELAVHRSEESADALSERIFPYTEQQCCTHESKIRREVREDCSSEYLLLRNSTRLALLLALRRRAIFCYRCA